MAYDSTIILPRNRKLWRLRCPYPQNITISATIFFKKSIGSFIKEQRPTERSRRRNDFLSLIRYRG